MIKNAYIHIPFCKQKCKYCSFISFTNSDYIISYVDSLQKEIDNRYKKETLDTLYFGGGTPSLLNPELLKKIINKFNLSPSCEITLELNPDDATLNYLKGLKAIGINRLSIGSQTFNDDILKTIGRRHNSAQTIKAVDLAQNAGFKNISLDLIYGLPNQNLEILKKDLNIITDLNIQHISTYGLKIEDESYWGKNPPKNIPDDDMQADMYLLIENFLSKKNFYRYEISNFALKNYESKHNINYWNNNEYYGFGVAAHGYLDGKRYYNSNILKKYLYNPTKPEYEHTQTEIEKLQEEIFLGFRKETGINCKKIKEVFNVDFEKKYENIISKFSPEYLVKTEEGYKLTSKGILLSNNILAEFM